MTRLRKSLLFCLIVFGLVLGFTSFFAYARNTVPLEVIPVIKVQQDPYLLPAMQNHALFRDAISNQDLVSLRSFAVADDYLALKASEILAEDDRLSVPERYTYLKKVNELRFKEPLAREGNRHFQFRLGQLAEVSGFKEEALEAYQEALPLAEAISSLKRLESDPYKLSNVFLENRLYAEALSALGGRAAPSLEAPAYRRLGDAARALEAYERWIIEVPTSQEAQLGKAWSHYSLGEYKTARVLFSKFSVKEALYGQALSTRRLGDLDEATELLLQTDDADYFWLATTFLEGKERFSDAIPIYLRLAKGNTKLADDAAYRAYILADRVSNAEAAQEALSLLKADSFFANKLGVPISLPTTESAFSLDANLQNLVNTLTQASEQETAKGELLFALRSASSVQEKLDIAELLQQMGEFRQSQRAISLLFFGSDKDIVRQDRRAWRLAYPEAYNSDVQWASQAFGVEDSLIWAIMRQESAFYPRAVSTSNAKGLMQVVPKTWDWLAELQNETPGDSFNEATNIRYGSFYIAWLSQYFADYNSDRELMIASYNRGQGYIRRLFEDEYVNKNKDDLYREIDSLETREYLQQVSLNYEIYRALYP